MRKKSYLKYFFYLILILTIPSCVNQKQIAYFQKGINGHDTLNVAKAYIPKIQPGDILAINIGSLNPAASSFLNPYSTMPVNLDATDASANGIAPTAASTQSASPAYLINTDGTIEIPLLGSFKLSGLTTTEARDTIRRRIILKDVLKQPTVNVRVTNYKVSVMGEVTRPSVYVIPNEKITIPEALSLAGDLTIFGKRNNVLIIRDLDGKKEFGRVNLNNRDLYTSPYYYLHNNDVVYVEPGPARTAQTDRTYVLLPVIFSALSLITIILEYSRH